MRKALLAAVVVAALAGPALAREPGPARPIWIVNATDQEIVFLYEKPQCCDIWEEDMLGGDRTLKPGERIRVDLGDFDGECQFTLFAQFADGQRRSGPMIDACRAEEFRFEWASLR